MNLRRKVKKALAGVTTLCLLCLAANAISQEASPEWEPDFLPMIQRNCVPNAEDRSPELYIV